MPLCWFKWIWFYHPLRSHCHKLQLSLWLKFPREPCISMSMFTFCIEDHTIHLTHYHYLVFISRNHISPRNWVHLIRKTMDSWELIFWRHLTWGNCLSITSFFSSIYEKNKLGKIIKPLDLWVEGKTSKHCINFFPWKSSARKIVKTPITIQIWK